MSGHVKLGFDDLTPDEARKLLALYESIVTSRPVIQPMSHAQWAARQADIERTASELVGNVPPPPAAPAAAPSVDASVPGGAPSTGSSTVPVDARGVPFDIRFHSGTLADPGLNDKGAWKKRRGHDPEGLAAYEEQFIGSGIAAITYRQKLAASAPSPTAGGSPAPVAPPDPNNPMSYPPAPPPPPPPSVVSFEEFARLWTALCAAQRVSIELETWIKNTHGGHPTLSDVFRHNPMARAQVYEVLRGYDVPAAA